MSNGREANERVGVGNDTDDRPGLRSNSWRDRALGWPPCHSRKDVSDMIAKNKWSTNSALRSADNTSIHKRQRLFRKFLCSADSCTVGVELVKDVVAEEQSDSEAGMGIVERSK